MTAKALVAEFIGTLFFLSIILNVVNDSSVGVIAIAVGLLAAIYMVGGVSGGHFNPAITMAVFVKERNNKIKENILFMLMIWVS